MIHKYLLFVLIFIIGEIIANLTFFNYLKIYFKVDKPSSGEVADNNFLGFDTNIKFNLLFIGRIGRNYESKKL